MALIEFASKNHVDPHHHGRAQQLGLSPLPGQRVRARGGRGGMCCRTVVRAGSHRSATKILDARSGAQP